MVPNKGFKHNIFYSVTPCGPACLSLYDTELSVAAFGLSHRTVRAQTVALRAMLAAPGMLMRRRACRDRLSQVTRGVGVSGWLAGREILS